MKKAEWLACTNPQWMLEFLRGKSSDRKQRLFAVACCRRVFDEYGYGMSFDEPLAWAEWYADGNATAFDLAKIEEGVQGDVCEPSECFSAVAAAVALAVATQNFDPALVPAAVIEAAKCCGYFTSPRQENEEYVSQCDILRDLFGEGLIRPVELLPTWLTPSLVELASHIYEKRSFDRLPALGKELKNAGCEEVTVLEHCRKKGTHVRGCWVVDLALGRE
jgi:hypothetical protein